MLQRRSGLDLDDEPLGAEHRGQLGLEHLERDLAVVLEVLRQKHRGHAALTEFALDAIAVGERGGEAGKRVSHAMHSSARFAGESGNRQQTPRSARPFRGSRAASNGSAPR